MEALTEESVPSVFHEFFDDAAVFPPGLAPLEKAVADHVARGPNLLAAAVGPLVLPLRDLTPAAELSADLDLSGGPIQVSVVTPAGQLQDALAVVGRVGPQLEVVAVEMKTSRPKADWTRELLEAAGAAGSVQIYVELTADQVAEGALELLRGTDLRLKYRTGGIETELFPTPEQLAAVLAAAVRGDTPFKLTAGLHRAVRYTDPVTGFIHHGFLNIAAATALAQEGASVAELAAVLGETSWAALKERFSVLSPSWRSSFTSFGTCSVAEPAESLEDLGILSPGTVSSSWAAEKVITHDIHT